MAATSSITGTGTPNRFLLICYSALQVDASPEEFRAENQLLGQMLQEAQADQQALEGRLTEAQAELEQQGRLLAGSLAVRQALGLEV